MVKEAKEIGLNISKTCENALKEAVKRLKGEESKITRFLGIVVARERFELSSAGPEPAMLDRYTTGLPPHPF